MIKYALITGRGTELPHIRLDGINGPQWATESEIGREGARERPQKAKSKAASWHGTTNKCNTTKDKSANGV